MRGKRSTKMQDAWGTRERNREIITRVRKSGERMADVGRDLGISRARVEQIVNYERSAIRREFAQLLDNGDIVRGTVCQICGGPATEAHHFDYESATHYVWLCKRCHGVADTLRQRAEGERLVGEATYNAQDAAAYLGVGVTTFNGWVKRHNIAGLRRYGRGGARYYRMADLDNVRARLETARIRDVCSNGHRLTPDNLMMTKAMPRGICRACNTIHASGGKRSPRASRYAVTQAFGIAGITYTEGQRSKVFDFSLNGVRFHMRAGGGSPWIVTVAGDRNSEARLWTAAEIVAYAKRNSRTEQMVA